MNEINK